MLDAYLRGEIKAVLSGETAPTGPALKTESPTPAPPRPISLHPTAPRLRADPRMISTQDEYYLAPTLCVGTEHTIDT